MATASDLVVFMALVCISFTRGEGSFITFHTQKGCNATLLCNQPGNVTWIKTATSQKIEGARFQTKTYSFFSTLSIVDVSEHDGGNITCVAEDSNITISVKVCYDITNTLQCQNAINNGDPCKSGFMMDECKKSCGLCPAPTCTETVLPTTAPITAHPETTETTNRNLTSTTESSVTASSPTPTGSLDKDKCAGVCNHGVSLAIGFHNLFTFASSFFAMMMLLFPNL